MRQPGSLRAQRAWCALAGLLLLQCAAAREEIVATVTHVFDGDSFIVRLDDGAKLEVRLAGIDAPEKGQPYADQARTALRSLILEQEVHIAVSDTDKYHRKVAQVYRGSDGLHINAELLRRGYAWVYRRVPPDHPFRELERLARDSGLGLWALPEAEREPPWRWRQEHPSTRVTSP
ncbi:MAG TPA: thermonuclease family protein [Steroidobacteraceae bacterium]|nr:thermonuclease family protein [Steroidobacteraceae bacterium]